MSWLIKSASCFHLRRLLPENCFHIAYNRFNQSKNDAANCAELCWYKERLFILNQQEIGICFAAYKNKSPVTSSQCNGALSLCYTEIIYTPPTI